MNKINKIFIIIIAILCIILGIVSYKYVMLKKDYRFASTFYARIEEITNNNILVQGLTVNDINFRGSYYLHTNENTKIFWRGTELTLNDLDVGDHISITYTYEIILASSPAPLHQVELIQLLDDSIEMNRDLSNTVNPKTLQNFNNQFIMYEEKNVGTNICALVRTILSSNLEKIEQEDYLVALKYDGYGGDLEDVYIMPEVNDVKRQEMLDFEKSIDKSHDYYIETKIGNNGIINEVIIYYSQPE